VDYIIPKKEKSFTKNGIETVHQFPQNFCDVQSFIGLCSYFRTFIEDFVSIAKLL